MSRIMIQWARKFVASGISKRERTKSGVLMKIKFTAVYEEIAKEEGGGYVAYVEELPGAITQGETLDEARENLRDAVEQLLAANRALAKENQTGHRVIHEPLAVSLA